MNDPLSLNCCGIERQEGGGGLQKGRGYLFVMDKRAGAHEKFQSSMDAMEGGGREGGREEECTCDNKGREWTCQSASGKQQMQPQQSKQ